MSLVEPGGTINAPNPNLVISLNVEEIDGDPCHQFAPDGPVEIWLVGSQRPRDAAGRDGMRIVTLPLQFPNYPIARRRARGIAQALGQLERAIARAQADHDHMIPALNDGHAHVVRFVRFSRKLPKLAICEICMNVLVDDIVQWAANRGLVAEDARYLGDEDIATVKAAIEKAFNQDGSSNG